MITATLLAPVLALLCAQAPLVEVAFDPSTARTGKILIVDVKTPPGLPPLTSVSPSLAEKDGVAFPVSADRRQWRALVPVDIESKTKKAVVLPQILVVDAVLADGRQTQWKKPIALKEGGYDKRNITVGKQFTSPSKKQQQRATRESKELSDAMKIVSADRLWRGSFAKPTPGDETSPFGTLRTYNKKRKSRHLGLDLDGDTGAPIVAANRGRVLIATDRFYSGGTVLLDHGQGLMTMYFHMSRIDVKDGQLVEKGQGLGAVGASGQVTGPHLHLSVKLGGEYVDPAQLLGLDLSADVDDEQGQRKPSSLSPAPSPSPSPPRAPAAPGTTPK